MRLGCEHHKTLGSHANLLIWEILQVCGKEHAVVVLG